MQYYFDKEEHNFKIDLPHVSYKTKTRPHHHTEEESVKIAIKESISRQKDVGNDLFQHAGVALGVPTSNFPKNRQEVNVQRVTQ